MNSTLNNALFMHYVINGASLSGVPSPTRSGAVIPLHRSPGGAVSPLGLVLGSEYHPRIETQSNRDVLRQEMNRLSSTEHPINSMSRTDLESKLNSHDSWIATEDLRRRVRDGLPAPAPDLWLQQLLRDDRGGSNTLALLAATRVISRIVLRNND